MTNQEQKDEIIRIYTQEHRGLLYCGKKVGIKNPKKVRQILVNAGIHIRNFSEAAIYSNKNRTCYKKNTSYFQTPSSNMAWLLGFIAADGTIRKNENEIKIGLARCDREILEKIQQEIETDAPIKDYVTNNGYECSSLQWTCQQHKEDLASYNIVPSKTFCLKPPIEKLPKEYWIDYIRGFFDGDGSVNYIHSQKGKGSLRWQLCSAQKEMLEWIVNFFYTEYSIPKVNIYNYNRKEAKHPLYYIQYSTSATKQIYQTLYTPNSLYLARKKNHYQDILQKFL